MRSVLERINQEPVDARTPTAVGAPTDERLGGRTNSRNGSLPETADKSDEGFTPSGGETPERVFLPNQAGVTQEGGETPILRFSWNLR